MRGNQDQGGRVRIVRHFSKVSPDLKFAQGFTLIEVLIAMTLLSIMVVLLFSSLRICAKSWEQGENKISDVNEVAVVYNFFQRHLALAIPLWDDFSAKDKATADSQPGTGSTMEGEDRIFSFQGKKQSLRFVSIFPASAGRSGMQSFSVQLLEEDGEQVVKVALTPFFPVTEGEEWHREEVVLLRHVGDFALSYFGVDDATGEGSWQNEWQEKDIQPQLVKIRINTANGVFWPEMIIELKVAGAVGNEEIGINAQNNAEQLEERE